MSAIDLNRMSGSSFEGMNLAPPTERGSLDVNRADNQRATSGEV